MFSDMASDLKNLSVRVGVIYGEDSYLFSQDVADYMFKVLDESVLRKMEEDPHYVPMNPGVFVG